MTRLLLVSCIAALLACTNLPTVLSSSVDVTDDGDPNDPTISVVSSLPETTYEGKLSLVKTTSLGPFASLTMQFKSGEQFCFFSPVLGLRDLACIVYLSKHWDTDVEIFVKDSENNVLNKSTVVASGSRLPFALEFKKQLPRADILQVCVHNYGSAKSIHVSINQIQRHVMREMVENIDNFTANHNATSELANRIGGYVADMVTFTKMDISTIRQDYYRLRSIRAWVDGRGICGSLAMLFCTFMSTVVIRRWFGSPRSSI